MRSIAVMNQKGGVGKTTTAVNLCAALSESGSRVCLLDIDPQAHASLHLGVDAGPDRPSVYEVLTNRASPGDVISQINDNLSLMPSSIDLAAVEFEIATVADRQMLLRDKLRDASLEFDYLIIDCPPSLGILTLNALVAVEEIIIPLQPHFLALHGLSKLLETIEAVATRINPKLKLSGVVFCMYDSGTRLAAEVSGDVEQFFANSRGQSTPWSSTVTFETRIRRNIRLAEAPSFGQSIFQYAPTSNGAADYRSLAEEIARGQ
jgi:chromosome partitioning protein